MSRFVEIKCDALIYRNKILRDETIGGNMKALIVFFDNNSNTYRNITDHDFDGDVEYWENWMAQKYQYCQTKQSDWVCVGVYPLEVICHER